MSLTCLLSNSRETFWVAETFFFLEWLDAPVRPKFFFSRTLEKLGRTLEPYSYINHQGGLRSRPPLQTGMPNPPVFPREVVVSSSSLHPGGPQYRSRHPVETWNGGSTPRWWSWYGGSSARHKWICLHLERRLTVHSGSSNMLYICVKYHTTPECIAVYRNIMYY